ncbi:MAG TPA: TonB-dependent receptor [Bryobacteraceae bacterium]|jgi:outer membrane cobalamin receptor|nr:TonB-dependent receptor [Bryobacteraceae bacterium]
MLRAVFILLCGAALFAQSDLGELRLKVTDPAGLAIPSSVELVSQSNQVRQQLQTDSDGVLAVKRLAFGVYRVRVTHEGFSTLSSLIEIRSALPKEYRVTLGLAPLETVVVVNDGETLLDPHRSSTADHIGPETLQDHPMSLPGRSLIDLVDAQPGWLLEANGVLHPRGSEYQVQYVVDGMPLMENRSPGFSPELEAEDVQSVTILTGGYPAEYGRKLGGVIEVTSTRDLTPGLHGKAVINGGSFDTAGGDLLGEYGWGKNTLTLGADADRTDHYLDPPVEQNFTNSGTNTDFEAHYERDLTDSDRVGLIVRRGQSRFDVPNEQVQEAAGQRQDRGTQETTGQFSYQHIFSANVIGDLRGMVRDISTDLWSNPLATPIIAAQARGLRETYLKASVSAHVARNEIKAGVEADFGSIREAFNYRITDPSQFDPGTPPLFQFANRAQDREQALFVQDLIRLGSWTFNAGVRWDHYKLLVDQSAVSPRLGAAWFWKAADIVFRASFDRIFQTPAFENLLLSSSPAVASLSGNLLRLPVQPSRGNFYEAGFAKGLFGKVRLDANYYRRAVNNFADDDLLLNTGVSFPIAFRSAEIHGLEVKLEIPRWGPVTGFVSYSNMLGIGYFPVTGGLFLGSDAVGVLNNTSSFPISQDQRNTVQSRFRYHVTPRFWLAMGGSYGSGLPVEFDGTYQDALAQYGPSIVSHVNFERGRVRPSFALSASAGFVIWKKEKQSLRLQGDVQNLTNRLNVIDFAGVFSGTALAAPRSGAVRLAMDF